MQDTLLLFGSFFFEKKHSCEISKTLAKCIGIDCWFVPDLRMRLRQAIYPRLPWVQTLIFHQAICAKNYFVLQWIPSVFSVLHGKMQWLLLTRKFLLHLLTLQMLLKFSKVTYYICKSNCEITMLSYAMIKPILSTYYVKGLGALMFHSYLRIMNFLQHGFICSLKQVIGIKVIRLNSNAVIYHFLFFCGSLKIL